MVSRWRVQRHPWEAPRSVGVEVMVALGSSEVLNIIEGLEDV